MRPHSALVKVPPHRVQAAALDGVPDHLHGEFAALSAHPLEHVQVAVFCRPLLHVPGHLPGGGEMIGKEIQKAVAHVLKHGNVTTPCRRFADCHDRFSSFVNGVGIPVDSVLSAVTHKREQVDSSHASRGVARTVVAFVPSFHSPFHQFAIPKCDQRPQLAKEAIPGVDSRQALVPFPPRKSALLVCVQIATRFGQRRGVAHPERVPDEAPDVAVRQHLQSQRQ
mmetsp:Transcript_20997/g.42954  ORF Transcript_20997/g.42954 Transcript_20997/m.42954 type:complete len:224 (+) Transcript_20997:689-1360(+)